MKKTPYSRVLALVRGRLMGDLVRDPIIPPTTITLRCRDAFSSEANRSRTLAQWVDGENTVIVLAGVEILGPKHGRTRAARRRKDQTVPERDLIA